MRKLFFSKKILFFILIFSVIPCAGFPAQPDYEDSGLSLHILPGFTMPIGEKYGSAFDFGGTVSLLCRFSFPQLPFLFLEGGAGFGVTPLKLADDAPFDSAMMYLISPKAGVGSSFRILPNLFAGAHIHGGYYYGFLDIDTGDNSGQNPFIDIGGDIRFTPVPSMGIGLDASYRNFFGLYSDIVLNLGVSYHFQAQKSVQIFGTQNEPYKEMVYGEISFDPVFPVFFKFYDVNPIGKITVKNTGKIPMEDVKVKVFINQYMDNPKVCGELDFLKGGAEQEVFLYALFNEKVLDISEATKVQINIMTESTVAGVNYSNEEVQTLRLYDRNATTWEDDRRAAAFVSLKDPTVLRFSKNVKSMVQGKAPGALDDNFVTCMAFHSALRLFGMSYVVDPSTPYTEFSKKKAAVDYLQFPSQTLDYKAGDCDDLSILYCALLESVGIETAFITVPGHIFIAFSLDMDPAEAKKRFHYTKDFIFIDEKTWCPFEITVFNEGFVRAWQIGSKQWNDHAKSGGARLYPVREAWQTYEPVGISGKAVSISLPAAAAVVKEFGEQLERFYELYLYPRVAKLEEDIKKSKGSIRDLNALGVLYARYGFYDKAAEQFTKVLAKEDHYAVLINLGNIAFLKEDFQKALDYYTRAEKKRANDPVVVLSLARVYFELAEYRKAETSYKTLAKLDRNLADKYGYLNMAAGDDTARAAGAEAMKEAMIWSE
ncbi:MAG: tetratricopeptide repeat protein [Spirochaetales bacterium]|nr:tetratricopeptide repeat protein [Spirochaetales bacterium]